MFSLLLPSLALCPQDAEFGRNHLCWHTAERQRRVKYTRGRGAQPVLRKETAHDFCLRDAFPRDTRQGKGNAEARLTSRMVERLQAQMTRQAAQPGGRATGPPCSPRGTHDAVGWRRAPDEALDLAFLPVEGVLGLGAGDDGGSCWGDSITSGVWEGVGPSWQVQKFIHSFSRSANSYWRPVYAR